MKTFRILSVAVLAIGLAGPVAAQHAHNHDGATPGGHGHGHGAHTPDATAALLERLREGGHVLFVRHERTEVSKPDDADYALDDCATQRNLSVAGMASAKEFGKSLRALRVPVGTVLASPMCRTLETARAMFGRAEAEPGLHGRGRDGRALGAGLRHLATEQASKLDGTNAVIVAHIANLQYAFGTRIHEGDAAVIELHDGEPRLVGTIPANAWNDMLLDALRENTPISRHAHEVEQVQGK